MASPFKGIHVPAVEIFTEKGTGREGKGRKGEGRGMGREEKGGEWDGRQGVEGRALIPPKDDAISWIKLEL